MRVKRFSLLVFALLALMYLALFFAGKKGLMKTVDKYVVLTNCSGVSDSETNL